ncbi:MAG: hypothetical protein QW038_01205 [Nanopusillaceae archaeon]
MTAENFSSEEIEKVYDFLDENFKKLLELERESIQRNNVTREGNLVKIKANGPVYIVPNYISLWYFVNKNMFDKKLKKNTDSLIILNNYPGDHIFNDFDISFLISGFLELNKYYEILEKHRGKIISLGGKNKINAIKWIKNKFDLDLILIKKLINELYSFYSLNKNLKELEKKHINPEILKFNLAINDDDMKKRLLEIILYYTNLPSAVYIDFGHKKILDIPGALPLLAFNKKLIKKYLKQGNLENLENILIRDFKFFSLDHIIEMEHGSFFDRKISYENNISIENVYQLEYNTKEIYKLPIKKKVLFDLYNEKSRFYKEIFKYLLFTEGILKKSNLDYIIAGSESINTSISINDPTDKMILYNKSKIYLIEIDPDNLEKKEKIKIYDHLDNVKEMDLNYKNKIFIKKVNEIVDGYKEAIYLFALSLNNVLFEENLEESILALLYNLILDEAYNQMPFLKKRIENKNK